MEPAKNAPLGARASHPHKAWHNRGYLPHFDEAGRVQFLAFRLMEESPVKAVWCALQGSGGGWEVVCRNKVRAGRPRSRGATTGLCSETHRAGPVELPAKVGGERAS